MHRTGNSYSRAARHRPVLQGVSPQGLHPLTAAATTHALTAHAPVAAQTIGSTEVAITSGRPTVQILGPVEFVNAGGERHALKSSSQRRLLTLLACHAGQTVPGHRLAELLEFSHGALRTTVRRIRQRLGADIIRTGGGGYGLGDVAVDATEFLRLRSEALTARDSQLPRSLEAALRVWRGVALAEFEHEPWAAGEAARLNELRAATLDALSSAYLATGRAADAVAALERQVRSLPFRDESRRLLMQALHAAGRTAEALRSYQQYRSFLIDETGTEPPRATRQIETQIASQLNDLPLSA